MINSRSRAMTVIAIAFALGLIVGGASLAMAARSGNAGWIWRGRGPRNTANGYATQLVRRLHVDADSVHRDSINAAWCRGELAMDSLRAPIRRPTDSLMATIRPRIDSLFQSIRPAVETRREQTRTEIRALLTSVGQQRYDSMNRADDEQRKKMRDQQGTPPTGGGGTCSGSPGGPGPRGGFDRGPH